MTRKQLQKLLDSLNYGSTYIADNFEIPPKGKTKGKVELFTLGEYATTEEVKQEYENKGLVPDLYAVIAYLKDNPDVLEEKEFIGVQLERNNYCMFDRWDVRRRVYCLRYVNDWYDNGWFAGVRKSSDTGKLGTRKAEDMTDKCKNKVEAIAP